MPSFIQQKEVVGGFQNRPQGNAIAQALSRAEASAGLSWVARLWARCLCTRTSGTQTKVLVQRLNWTIKGIPECDRIHIASLRADK